jgi:protein-disulfide isomerase
MNRRVLAILLAAPALAAAAFAQNRKVAAPAAPAPAAVTPADVQAYAAKFLPFDPESKVTVDKAPEHLPGMQGWKVHRKGRYEKLNVERVYYVSDDGKWFFAGDSMTNPSPKPVRSAADLGWVEEKFSTLFRTGVRVSLVPERDAPPYKGVAIGVETGYGPVRMPGYVSADGKAYLQGTLWDFRMDPREDRRRRIDLSANRATGRPDAPVNIVEFADMECGYCKMRGLQMDRLLEANAGIVNARRHYKFFPLWFGHVWAMKAASAADCLFQAVGAAPMFKFKEAVYGRQETMTLSGIDELAVMTAEADGVNSADFLGCYLREGSFGRIRREIEEGYRLGVNSTPTYFIDGTEITWLEDKVMEDFLRTLFPKVKTVNYAITK